MEEMILDGPEFQKRADSALQSLFDALNAAADSHGFEADFNAGALTIEFDDPPAKFVVSPNSPVGQIWVSANVKSFKLDWDAARAEFVLPATGQNLRQLVAEAVSIHLGEQVEL